MVDGDKRTGREVSGFINLGGESNLGSSVSSGVTIFGGGEEYGGDMGEPVSVGGLHIAILGRAICRGRKVCPSN